MKNTHLQEGKNKTRVCKIRAGRQAPHRHTTTRNCAHEQETTNTGMFNDTPKQKKRNNQQKNKSQTNTNEKQPRKSLTRMHDARNPVADVTSTTLHMSPACIAACFANRA